MNNDILSPLVWFANDFHEWLLHSKKSLANHLTRDQKSLFKVTHALFYISWSHYDAGKWNWNIYMYNNRQWQTDGIISWIIHGWSGFIRSLYIRRPNIARHSFKLWSLDYFPDIILTIYLFGRMTTYFGYTYCLWKRDQLIFQFKHITIKGVSMQII